MGWKNKSVLPFENDQILVMTESGNLMLGRYKINPGIGGFVMNGSSHVNWTVVERWEFVTEVIKLIESK